MINTDKTLLMHYNIDTQGNTMAVKIDNEPKQVSPLHYCVQLSQVVDEAHRMVVLDDTNKELIEVYNMDEIKENNYYINYTSSVVYFHPSKASKVCIFNYYGLGLELFGASRIYDEATLNGEFIFRTLQEIIDKGRECINALLTIGDAIQVLYRIEEDIATGTILHNNLLDKITVGTQLKIDLNTTINNANTKKTELEGTISTANASKTNLETATTNANTKKVELEETTAIANTANTTLNTSNANAQASINLIRSAGNPHFDILIADWVTNTDTSVTATYMKDIVHNLGTESIQINCVDINSKMSVLPNFKIVNTNTIRLFTDSKVDIRAVLSARYYDGGSDIGDEVKLARGDKSNLKVRLDGVDLKIAKDMKFSAVHFLSALSINTSQNESDDLGLIRTIEGKYCMIDCGYPNTFDFYKNKMDKLGITEIEWLFFTHQHNDHCGNYEQIIRTYRPKKIYLRYVDFDKLPSIETTWGTKALHLGIIALAVELNIPVIALNLNDVIQLSPFEKIKVLGNIEDRWNDYNYLCCAFLYSYSDSNILFASDLQHGSADINIISLLPQLSILKVAHHGVGSIVGMPIIKATNPIYSIINSHLNVEQPKCSNRIISIGSEVSLIGENDGIISFTIADNVVTTSCRPLIIKTVYDEGDKKYVAINGAYTKNSIQNIKGKEYVVLTDGEIAKGSFFSFDYPNYEQYATTDGVVARCEWVYYTNSKWYYLKANGIEAKNESIWIEGQIHTFDANGICTTKV